jgi:cytochrome b6-f complex iron-sulfur subunit
MKSRAISRREFCADIGKGAIAVALAVPLSGIETEAKSAPMTPITLDLTIPEYAVLANVGVAVKISNPHDKKKPIIVSRLSETEVAAFSSKCTHFGCEVSLPINGVITCPCHKAQFDASGKVLHGPAKKDLKAFDVALNGTTVVIKDKTAK